MSEGELGGILPESHAPETASFRDFALQGYLRAVGGGTVFDPVASSCCVSNAPRARFGVESYDSREFPVAFSCGFHDALQAEVGIFASGDVYFAVPPGPFCIVMYFVTYSRRAYAFPYGVAGHFGCEHYACGVDNSDVREVFMQDKRGYLDYRVRGGIELCLLGVYIRSVSVAGVARLVVGFVHGVACFGRQELYECLVEGSVCFDARRIRPCEWP